MFDQLWRGCGDGCRHLFAARGEFIATESVFAIRHCIQSGQNFVHEVEVYRGSCGAEIPVAALMPHDVGTPCHSCEKALAIPAIAA